MLSVNDRVMLSGSLRLGQYTGTIIDEHVIVLFDETTTVYDVEWDGDPDCIPARWKDEDGTDKAGYTEDQLTKMC